MLRWRTIIWTLVSGMITMRSTSSIFSWKCFNCTRQFIPNLLPNWIHKIFISDFWEIKWFLQFCNKELNKNFRFLRAHLNPFLVFQQMVLGLSLPSHWNAEKNKKKEREGEKKRTMDKRQSEDNESQNYKLATTYPSFRAGTNLRVL